jgi:hypothetical protein
MAGVSHLPTRSGYKFGEVLSALQKEIRRGDEEAAMYWAIELEDRWHSHLWSRLMVIVHEEIGLASMETVMFVQACKEEYKRLRGIKNWSCTMVLTNVITAMCRSPKSRLSDDLKHIVYRRTADEVRSIPDYALDKHTGRGRRMGRGFEHWIEEGARIVPSPFQDEAPGFNPYRDRRIAKERTGPPFWNYGEPNPTVAPDDDRSPAFGQMEEHGGNGTSRPEPGSVSTVPEQGTFLPPPNP